MDDTYKTTPMTKSDATDVKPVAKSAPANTAATKREDVEPMASTKEELMSDPIVPENPHDPKPPRAQDLPAQGVLGAVRVGLSQEQIQSPVQLRQGPTSDYDEQTSDIDMGGDKIDRRINTIVEAKLEPKDPRARATYPLVDNPDHENRTYTSPNSKTPVPGKSEDLFTKDASSNEVKAPDNTIKPDTKATPTRSNM